MKFLFAILISALALNTCDNESTEKTDESIFFVNSAKVDCTGVGKMRCLQVQETDSIIQSNWENFYGSIEGFEYEPGYIYKLLVNKEELDPATVPADASTLKYTLVKVIDKKVDEKLRLNDIWLAKAINGKTIEKEKLKKQPILEIHLNNMKLIGNDGCNNIFGKIATLNANAITFDGIGGTKMACPNMDISSEYRNALSKIKTFKHEKLQLYFYDSEGNELLKFQKID